MRTLFTLVGMVFALIAVLPAVAQIAPAGGTTLQEGVVTTPTPCPDGSQPADISSAPNSSEPTDTSTPPVPVTSGAVVGSKPLCPPSGQTTTGAGVDPTDTPAAVAAPSMK